MCMEQIVKMKVTIIGKLNQSFKNIKYKNTFKDKIYLDRTISKLMKIGKQ